MAYFPKPSLNENDLAIIERGDTAAHSIETGQCVSWHGKTGRAKAAILQGTTLEDSMFDYNEDGVLNTSLKTAELIDTVTVTSKTVNIDFDKYSFIIIEHINISENRMYGSPFVYPTVLAKIQSGSSYFINLTTSSSTYDANRTMYIEIMNNSIYVKNNLTTSYYNIKIYGII